jgi:circadian clock protein KaiB
MAIKFQTSHSRENYFLRLYVAGTNSQSVKAIANLKQICIASLDGCYDLQVVDIYQQPELAKRDQIIAVPTLIKFTPLPLRRLIGDMSDVNKVLKGLGISTVNRQ